MEFRENWEALHPRLHPFTPAGDPSTPEVRRVDRPDSPIDRLVQELKRPPGFGLRHALIYGPPGSGKTTELLAVLGRLTNEHLVLLVDLRAHFQEQRGDVAALDHLQPWEVLAIVGLAVHRFGQEALGHDWTKAETKALGKALAGPGKVEAASLDIAKLGKEIALLVAAAADAAGAGGGVTLALRALGAAAGSASLKLPLGLPGRTHLPDQDGDVQSLKHAVTHLLLALLAKYERRVLLVVDGIDRGGSDLASRLFEHSQLLHELPCHQLISVPPATRVRNVRGYDPLAICNLPVVDRERAPEPGEGTAFFWKLWEARTKAAGVSATLATHAQVAALAWASGGMVRQFLEMLQHAVGLAWDDDGPLLDKHIVEIVGRWRRRWKEGITSERQAALNQVEKEYLLDGSDLQHKLLDERCIVAFPGDPIWYYPHPLLTARASTFAV